MEPEVLSVLKDYGIHVPKYKFVTNEDDAQKAAMSLGWPVVMKIVSPDILHKTEAGGVILGLQTEKQVSDAFARLSLLERTGTRISGFIIYPFQKHDIELSVGMVRDLQFGPVITFGLGGIWIEVIKDIAFGIAPLSHGEAEDMLDSIKAHSILKGIRNRKPSDRKALSDLLVSLADMTMKETAIQEIDLNPIFPLEKNYFIADGRIIL